jgi:hypothetical protein
VVDGEKEEERQQKSAHGNGGGEFSEQNMAERFLF